MEFICDNEKENWEPGDEASRKYVQQKHASYGHTNVSEYAREIGQNPEYYGLAVIYHIKLILRLYVSSIDLEVCNLSITMANYSGSVTIKVVFLLAVLAVVVVWFLEFSLLYVSHSVCYVVAS